MHNTGEFAYAETDALQIVELPYQSLVFEDAGDDPRDIFSWATQLGRFAMTIVLPRNGRDIDALGLRLAAEGLAGLPNPEFTRVRLTLPRFRVESQMSFGETLQSWGVREAFSRERADFTRMSSHPEGLFVGEVLHQAFVEVNEQGTEAAAATAVCLVGGSLAPPAPPKEFRADHPFVFVIRDKSTGLVHFIGRYLGP